MPPIEYGAVITADISFFRFRGNFINDGYGLGEPWLSIIFVGVELFTLFLIARRNKTLAALALFTAIITTVLVIVVVSKIASIVPD